MQPTKDVTICTKSFARQIMLFFVLGISPAFAAGSPEVAWIQRGISANQPD
jgi:hypothetical protein